MRPNYILLGVCLSLSLGVLACGVVPEKKIPLAEEDRSFYHEPWGWRFNIPEMWNLMSDKTMEKIRQIGQEAIDEADAASVTGDETVLQLDDEKPNNLFAAISWSHDYLESIPYYESRMERFNFYKDSYAKRSWMDVSYEVKGIYLGDLYLEVLYVRGESKRSNQVISQANFETIWDGEIFNIVLNAGNLEDYHLTLDSIYTSTFKLPAFEIPEDWQSLLLGNTSFKIPPGFKQSQRSTEDKLHYAHPEESVVISIEKSTRASGPTIENPSAKDMGKVLADLDFKLLQTTRGKSETVATEEAFLAGKRCFIGAYNSEYKGEDWTDDFAYVIGQNADYKVHVEYPAKDFKRKLLFKQILISLREELSFEPSFR